MPNLNDVYRKFGEVSEAAQLLETELGTMLLNSTCIEDDLIENPDSKKASAIYEKINKNTLGQLMRKLKGKDSAIEDLECLLNDALDARNYLAHSFYLRHNFRRNSNEGCEIMLKDLEQVHDQIVTAYKAVMLLSGVDLDELSKSDGGSGLPSKHLPI